MSKKAIKIFVLLLGVSFFLSNAQAQGKIEFTESVHDFGSVPEKGGLVSHEFEFVNVGNAPVVIQRVSTSCGCTSPNWTKTPVEPKGKGKIKVTFNPNGRPYPINKTITVYSNASNKTATLKITGNVVKEENLKRDYPAVIGNALRLKNKVVSLGTIKKGNKGFATFFIANDSKKTMKLEAVNPNKGFKIEVFPKVLNPNQKGTIRVQFDSNNVDEWGSIKRDFSLKIDGVEKKNTTDKLTLNAKIVEDFSNLTIVQKRNAPIVQVKSKILEFGKIKQGKMVKGKIYIKNVGENVLEVRKISTFSKELVIKPSKTELKSGKKSKLRIYVDTKNSPKGNFEKTFSVLTNDPMNSEMTFVVKYTVK